MDTHSIKLNLIEWLLQLDEKTLLKVDRIRKTKEAADIEHRPMTIAELKGRALASEEDIVNGRTISIEDLEKEMKAW